MNGRRLVLGFLAFTAVFVGALVWFQFFAFYERQGAVDTVQVDGRAVPVSGYEGIDATSSPLKLRACLRLDPAAVADLAPAPDATPLNAPFWFRCFDAGTLTEDIASGAARAHALSRGEPAGFDLFLAVYPDGRGYLWRQLEAGVGE